MEGASSTLYILVQSVSSTLLCTGRLTTASDLIDVDTIASSEAWLSQIIVVPTLSTSYQNFMIQNFRFLQRWNFEVCFALNYQTINLIGIKFGGFLEHTGTYVYAYFRIINVCTYYSQRYNSPKGQFQISAKGFCLTKRYFITRKREPGLQNFIVRK